VILMPMCYSIMAVDSSSNQIGLVANAGVCPLCVFYKRLRFTILDVTILHYPSTGKIYEDYHSDFHTHANCVNSAET